MLSMGVLKYAADTNNIIDDKLKHIIQAYNSANFSQANDLIKNLCEANANILNTIFPDLAKKLVEQQNKLKLEQYYIDYIEPVEILIKSKSSGVIKSSELSAIEKNEKIDQSEYIMLAVGVLNKYSKTDALIDQKLKEIRQNYLATNYQTANKIISDICTDYTHIINKEEPDLSQRLLNLQDKCEEVDVMKNYTRRFFENRVGALYLGTEINYDATLYI